MFRLLPKPHSDSDTDTFCSAIVRVTFFAPLKFVNVFCQIFRYEKFIINLTIDMAFDFLGIFYAVCMLPK
jgi:hypothetical protein